MYKYTLDIIASLKIPVTLVIYDMFPPYRFFTKERVVQSKGVKQRLTPDNAMRCPPLLDRPFPRFLGCTVGPSNRKGGRGSDWCFLDDVAHVDFLRTRPLPKYWPTIPRYSYNARIWAGWLAR